MNKYTAVSNFVKDVESAKGKLPALARRAMSLSRLADSEKDNDEFLSLMEDILEVHSDIEDASDRLANPYT